jgi:hypothetical protein
MEQLTKYMRANGTSPLSQNCPRIPEQTKDDQQRLVEELL